MQASSNAQDSISLIQTAEGALQETHVILQRMKTLQYSLRDTKRMLIVRYSKLMISS